MIAIKDYGTGISEHYLPNIFDPYFSTKKQGNGLGLSTSYSIIKKHNGHIKVDTEEGKGSEFSFYIPAIDDYVPEKKEFTIKELTGSGIILLMDDEQLIRNVAGKMLQSFGYEVVYARDGGEAIDEYRKCIESGQAFDAVILDLTVPGGMGGKDTIKELIKIDPSVKAIVSTGYSNDPVMSDFQSYGFVDYVPKPYKAKELAEVVGRVVSVI